MWLSCLGEGESRRGMCEWEGMCRSGGLLVMCTWLSGSVSSLTLWSMTTSVMSFCIIGSCLSLACYTVYWIVMIFVVLYAVNTGMYGACSLHLTLYHTLKSRQALVMYLSLLCTHTVCVISEGSVCVCLMAWLVKVVCVCVSWHDQWR